MAYQSYPDWAAGIYYALGEIVKGSDGNLYKAKDRHLSASGNKPITGGSYATYWVATNPSVPRARKPNGGIEMQPMVSNDNRKSAAPSYESVMRQNPYQR